MQEDYKADVMQAYHNDRGTCMLQAGVSNCRIGTKSVTEPPKFATGQTH